MKIALATTPGQFADALTTTDSKISVLISYWYCRNDKPKLIQSINNCKATGKPFYLDSGVFTARKKGVDIPLDEYLSFCTEFKNDIDYFFNLDLGDHARQLSNCATLYRAGVPVIGIVSNKMTFEQIKAFCDVVPYIAVSYSASGFRSGQSDYLAYLDRLFGYLYNNGYKTTKVHGLGLTKYEVLKTYPFFSVDSSTWVNPLRFGTAYKFENGEMKLYANTKKGITMREGGVGVALQHHLKSDRAKIISHSVQAFYEMQIFLTKLWTKRGIVWN